jgi:hypothetical protein
MDMNQNFTVYLINTIQIQIIFLNSEIYFDL